MSLINVFCFTFFASAKWKGCLILRLCWYFLHIYLKRENFVVQTYLRRKKRKCIIYICSWHHFGVKSTLLMIGNGLLTWRKIMVVFHTSYFLLTLLCIQTKQHPINLFHSYIIGKISLYFEKKLMKWVKKKPIKCHSSEYNITKLKFELTNRGNML